jgi:phosphotransacetylase
MIGRRFENRFIEKKTGGGISSQHPAFIMVVPRRVGLRLPGIEAPKVGIFSAVETVNPRIPSTLYAAALCKMADRGQITVGILDGPLAFDNAISTQAVRTKDLHSPVSGDVDILLAPDLESANMLFKQLTYLASVEAAGIVLGTRVPVVLTTRSDSVRTRLASTAVMTIIAHARRSGKVSET